jgi:hypothetical protein
VRSGNFLNVHYVKLGIVGGCQLIRNNTSRDAHMYKQKAAVESDDPRNKDGQMVLIVGVNLTT